MANKAYERGMMAAGKELRHACGRIEQIFAQKETPLPTEWEAMYAREVRPVVQAYLEAYDPKGVARDVRKKARKLVNLARELGDPEKAKVVDAIVHELMVACQRLEEDLDTLEWMEEGDG